MRRKLVDDSLANLLVQCSQAEFQFVEASGWLIHSGEDGEGLISHSTRLLDLSDLDVFCRLISYSLQYLMLQCCRSPLHCSIGHFLAVNLDPAIEDCDILIKKLKVDAEELEFV